MNSKEEEKDYVKKINVMDLFAGVGGLSYGFHKNEVFDVVFANDVDKNATGAYKLNFPDTNVKTCCISEITDDMLKEYDIDVLIGGPPCQSYSTLGNRKMDKKANLFKEYNRILNIVKPKIFVYENVKGLLSMKNGKLIKEIVDLFEKSGYVIQYKLLNFADYGVPQLRERIILVGTKNGNFKYPDKTHDKYITMNEALSDLPSLLSNQRSSKYKSKPKNKYQVYLRDTSIMIEEHIVPNHNSKLVKMMSLLPDGGTIKDIPEEYKPKTGFGNSYSKLWWNKPVTTITRNFGTPSSARCIHPVDSRALTTREGARLQSFPDTFKFYGSRSNKNLQIGNAVPPIFSISLAKCVRQYLN